MKNLYKKILPFFGASFCFIPNLNKTEHIFINKEDYKDNTIIAKTNKNLIEKTVFNPEKTKQIQEFLNDLNKTEIYLLVTELKKEKNDNPILLLLHTEDRLNSEQSLINYRHLKFLFSLDEERPRFIKTGHFSINEIVRPNWFPSLAKTFRNGKSYYVNNLGGYKSICPVFFDKASAEDFLLQTSKDALILLKTLPLDSNKEILQGLLNTKIISIGLGDFVEYYSKDKNKTYLEKVDFLFVPCLQKQKNLSKNKQKKITGIVNSKNFKQYQDEYYKVIS
jgi:hypothetical protein